MLPFTLPSNRTITAEVEKPWYEHPPSVRCLCGSNIYARVQRDAKGVYTTFECGDPKCGKLVIFKDLSIDSSKR